ncbi:hypothetical protein H6771_01660 [Candidatus Peribacteria bacterium]|nr:hypothetical protein [Candidatus Peribacteria bacterium]
MIPVYIPQDFFDLRDKTLEIHRYTVAEHPNGVVTTLYATTESDQALVLYLLWRSDTVEGYAGVRLDNEEYAHHHLSIAEYETIVETTLGELKRRKEYSDALAAKEERLQRQEALNAEEQQNRSDAEAFIDQMQEGDAWT